MKENKLVVNNLLINYYVTENPDPAAKTVIFLHGWRSDGKVWGPVVRILEETSEYQIYCLDLPGFGKSQKPVGSFQLGDYSTLVKEFIQKLNLEKVFLVGHSFGGRIAIKLAAAAPAVIFKLVLVDSAGVRALPKYKLLKKLLAKILRPLFALPALKSLRQKIYEKIGAEDYVATPELTRTFLNIINEDLKNLLPKINISTIIIWGENDQETPLEHGKIMHSAIPNSKLVILQNAGHFSFIDNTAEFTKVLRDFFDVPFADN